MEKKLKLRTIELQNQYPNAKVEVWAMDEHRVGLKPVLRRIWVPWWDTPTAEVHWRFQWVWVYGFVHPESGETYWWVLPRVNTHLFNQVLADFAREFGLGDRKHVLLTVDRAGWHMSKEVQIPHGLHLEFLPPYSPELQPAERLWTLTNEPIANNYFKSINELEDALVARCQVLLEHKGFISRLTCYHWWPKTSIYDN